MCNQGAVKECVCAFLMLQELLIRLHLTLPMTLRLLTTLVFIKDEQRQGDFFSIPQIDQLEPGVGLILHYVVCNSIFKSSQGNTFQIFYADAIECQKVVTW